ncbi:MAG: disulfide bond formation protein B, partial [Pseudomonadota bacterium]
SAVARSAGFLALAIMVLAIGGAWAFQLIGGIKPCPLCLEQRVPYYAAIPIAAIALFLSLRVPGLARLGLLAAAAVMIWGVGLGVYHAGAEWAFWPGPNTCGDAGQEVRDASNLLAVIEETELISCTQETGRVLGLSFAGWNVVAAGSAALLMLFAAARPTRPAQ